LILDGDDLLAAYKFSRFNNYKENLYNCLSDYDDIKFFSKRQQYNNIISKLFAKETVELGHIQFEDERLKTVF